MNICTGEKLKGDRFLSKDLGEFLDPFQDGLTVDQEHAVEHVGRGHDGLDPVVDGDPAHLECLFGRDRSVIQTGQDMAVKIDHGVSQFIWLGSLVQP
jgi:hypothetical protein